MQTASDVNVDRHLVRYGKPPKLNQRHDSDAVRIFWSREVPDHSSKIYIAHPFEGVFVLCQAKKEQIVSGWLESLRFFSLNKYIFLDLLDEFEHSVTDVFGIRWSSGLGILLPEIQPNEFKFRNCWNCLSFGKKY